MKTHGSKDSAFKSLEVYLSAANDPDSLRVNASEDVERASSIVVMFNRATRLLKKTIDENYSPTNWKSKAFSAVVTKFIREMTSVHGKLNDSEIAQLTTIISNVSQTDTNQWKDRISEEIRTLNKNHQAALAKSLERVYLLGRPENHKLFPYAQQRIYEANKKPIEPSTGTQKNDNALELAIQDYMKTEFGYEDIHAVKAAKTISHVMKKYDSSVTDALNIVSYAGKISLEKPISNLEDRAIPVAFLKLRHGLSLQQSVDLYATAQINKIEITELKPLAEVMQAYQVDSGTAAKIVDRSELLKKDPTLESISQPQLTEIAWLIEKKNKSNDEATLISLKAGRILSDIPIDRSKQLDKEEKSLNEQINEAFERSSPAGWPDSWDLMPDGSRRLRDKSKFEAKYMEYFQGCVDCAVIDDTQGLANQFLKDVGRSQFKFGVGKNSTKIQLNGEKALEQLQSLIPDKEVRKNISKTIDQTGNNGFVYAMGFGLMRNEDHRFLPITLIEESNKQNEGTNTWISVQAMQDEGKIRIGYIAFFKHFSLIDPIGDTFIPLNSQSDKTTPPDVDDHTARATALVEFDVAELRRGIVKLKFARPPELSLKLELDRETYLKRLVKKELNANNK